MAQNFIACDREQALLLAPSLRDWLPADHLAWFVLDAVEQLDLSAIYCAYRDDGHGRPAHEPAMMVALWVYAFARGVRSARAIERRCVEDVAFRVIAANLVPDHSTLSRFVRRHQEPLAGLFEQMLGFCVRAGLVEAGVVAVDSTKVAANASGYANRSYREIAREIVDEALAVNDAEDERLGERRGDELPAELADGAGRRRRLAEIKQEMEREWEAERAERQAMLDRRAEHERRTGQRPPGRPPMPRDLSGDPPGRVNTTDPESALVKTPRGFIQGYNAHVAATDGGIVIAAELTNVSRDQGMLAPMVADAHAQLTAAGSDGAPRVVVADAGYWINRDIVGLDAEGLTVLVPPDAHTRTTPLPERTGGVYEQMRRALASEPGRGLYRRRQAIVEPVFGDMKFNRRADRFRRRGLAACRAEWRLICATHNLLKLWRAAPARA